MKNILSKLKKYRIWIVVVLLVSAVTFSVVRNLLDGPTKKTATSPSSAPAASTSPTDRSVTVSNPASGVETPSASPAVPSPSPKAAPTLLADRPFLYSDYDQNQQAIYFLDPNDNQLKRYAISTQETTDLAKGSAYIQHLVWSPDHTKAIIFAANEQGNRVANPLYSKTIAYGENIVGLLTFATGSFVPLNSNIQDVIFTGNNSIMYHYQDEKYSTLSISEANNNNWKEIAKATDTIEFVRQGNDILVNDIKTDTVSRYTATGKLVETFTKPNELALPQSVWSPIQKESIFWQDLIEDFLVSRLKDGKVTPIASFPKDEEEMTILWDNKLQRLYYTNIYGLFQIKLNEGQ